jgi:hypothetical protein
MKQKQYDFKTAYIDLLLNMFTTIVCIVMVMSFMIAVNKKVTEEGQRREAHMVVTVSWPQEADCDVDIWGRAPNNEVIYFQRRESALMFLDRDDLGWTNDKFVTSDGLVEFVSENKEYMTIRGKIPGEYVFGVHLYGCRHGATQYSQLSQTENLEVTGELFRINPQFIRIEQKKVTLPRVWDKAMIFRFVLDAEGNIEQMIDDPLDIVAVEKGVR